MTSRYFGNYYQDGVTSSSVINEFMQIASEFDPKSYSWIYSSFKEYIIGIEIYRTIDVMRFDMLLASRSCVII
jgi:hypothetical protein